MTTFSAQRLRDMAARRMRRALLRVDPAAARRPGLGKLLTASGETWSQPLPETLGSEKGSATATLLARLTPEVVSAVDEWIAADPYTRQAYASAVPADRRRLRIALGMHHGVEGVARLTGLPTAQPPEHVHAMARGPLAAAGGLYEADLVADTLAGAGVAIDEIRSALDFGCSSGRVLRVLSAAYPEVSWHGCDPNGPAIEWARGALPGVRFFRSGDAPPLDLPDASLDLVYAISIWSHFAPQLGLLWLDEMHRIVRPGGHLLMTTHGNTTIRHDVERGLRSREQATFVARALADGGAWYSAEFGARGDWGVVNPEWGTAFLSAEWVLSHVCPRWQVLEFAPGRNSQNQDVWLLRRA